MASAQEHGSAATRVRPGAPLPRRRPWQSPRAVFLGHGDYETYLHRLALYRARYAVTLHAYCLMPNHVHLVVSTAAAPLDRFMQCLQQSYTQGFNRRYVS